MKDQIDAEPLLRALMLASRGTRATAPNPRVGAVVVTNDLVVGEGWHERAGEAHAEVRALDAAGPRARGGVLYSSLEPCAHSGRTPPCTDAIIRAGLRKVVVGLIDPDTQVSGRGVAALREAGLEVSIAEGELAEQAARVVEDYVVHRTAGRAFVAMKVAGTLDGRIADRRGHSRWVTGPAARQHGKALRERYGALVVGVGTVIADDPLLLPPGGSEPAAPFVRAVLDSSLRTPPGSRIVRDVSDSPVLIFAAAGAPVDRRRGLEAAGAEVVTVPDTAGRLSLRDVLEQLAERAVLGAIVEGGGVTHGRFLDAGLVDKVYWYAAPALLGDEDATAAVRGGVRPLEEAWRGRIANVSRLGEDVLLTLYPAETFRPCLPESSPR